MRWTTDYRVDQPCDANPPLPRALKIFTQEKIRWLTFQAGAVILGHALVSFYLPFLEIGRMVGWLKGKYGFGSSSNGNRDHQATRLEPLRLNPGDDGRGGIGCASGFGGSGETRRRQRGNSNSNAGNEGSSAGWGRRTSGGTGASPSPSIDCTAGEEPEHFTSNESGHGGTGGDSEAFGVGDGDAHGRAGSGSGSGRGWVRRNTRADGLEGLTRQVWSCLRVASLYRNMIVG